MELKLIALNLINHYSLFLSLLKPIYKVNIMLTSAAPAIHKPAISTLLRSNINVAGSPKINVNSINAMTAAFKLKRTAFYLDNA